MSGPHVAARAPLRDAVAEAWGKPLTMNVSMPIAAVMLDLGFPSAGVKAVPILARTAGLLAHLAEEQRAAARVPDGRARGGGDRVRAPPEDGPADARAGRRDPPVGGAARRRRRELPRPSSPTSSIARPSTARSWPRPGSPRPAAAGGLAEIAQLPLTEKRELRATCTPDNPIGAHLCAAPSEIVRIYSTSGTTGAPSYIPLTAGDLDNWVTGSARSYAASGIAAGQRIVSTYNAGPFVAGAALASFERIGLWHIPVGTGNTERLMRAIELLGPEAAVLTPSYAAYLVEWAAERGVDLRGSSVERVLVAGEPGGGEPAFRAKLEEGWGAQVTEAMGIGDIGVSLWGECEEQDGMHLGARGFVHPELIDPETGAALEMDDGATRRARADASAASRGAAAAVPHARSRRGPDEPVRVRPHGPARAVHRANRRHAHRPRGQRLPLGGARGGERVRAATSAATSSSSRGRRA